MRIDHGWRHRLCNPFWRLYLNDEDGARAGRRGADLAGWRLRAQALLLDCLAAALEQPSRLEAQLTRGNPVASALRHIDMFYHLPLTVPGLAELCALSPDRFTRVCKQRTALTRPRTCSAVASPSPPSA